MYIVKLLPINHPFEDKRVPPRNKFFLVENLSLLGAQASSLHEATHLR